MRFIVAFGWHCDCSYALSYVIGQFCRMYPIVQTRLHVRLRELRPSERRLTAGAQVAGAWDSSNAEMFWDKRQRSENLRGSSIQAAAQTEAKRWFGHANVESDLYETRDPARILRVSLAAAIVVDDPHGSSDIAARSLVG